MTPLFVESKNIQQTSEYDKKKDDSTDTESKLVVTSGVGVGGRYRGRRVGGTNYCCCC